MGVFQDYSLLLRSQSGPDHCRYASGYQMILHGLELFFPVAICYPGMFGVTSRRLALRVLGDKNALEKAIATSDKTRVVAWCTASWCGPCKSVTPFIEKFSSSTPNVDFYKIDIDEFPELAEELEVASVPTFIMFKDKQVAARLVGASAPRIEEMVKNSM
jgi:thioredoxin 1